MSSGYSCNNGIVNSFGYLTFLQNSAKLGRAGDQESAFIIRNLFQSGYKNEAKDLLVYSFKEIAQKQKLEERQSLNNGINANFLFQIFGIHMVGADICGFG
jgi:alpha-glucosidase (family GH31 glycosyl hydrolase)